MTVLADGGLVAAQAFVAAYGLWATQGVLAAQGLGCALDLACERRCVTGHHGTRQALATGHLGSSTVAGIFR